MTIYIGMEQAEYIDWLNRLLHEVLGCATFIHLFIHSLYSINPSQSTNTTGRGTCQKYIQYS
jgi:hypothetical protein